MRNFAPLSLFGQVVFVPCSISLMRTFLWLIPHLLTAQKSAGRFKVFNIKSIDLIGY